MPRIAYIPPPIDFSDDRGQQIMAPMLANAQNLANTFITEIPRIRMQQEAVAEDKRRYQSEQDYRYNRDKLADQRYDTSLKMTMEDRDIKAKAARAAEIQGKGDRLLSSIQPSMTLAGGKIAQVKGAKAGAASADPYDADMEAYVADLKRRADFRARAALDQIGEGDNKRQLTKDEIDAREEAAFGPSRVAPVREGSPAGASVDPFGSNEYPQAGAVDDRGLSMTMPDGSPRMSQAQLEMALAEFDAVKALPPEERAAHGFSDERLWNIYKHLQMQMGTGGEAPAAPASGEELVAAPAAPDTAEIADAAAAAPAAAPAPLASAASPQDEQTTLQRGLALYHRLMSDVQNRIGDPATALQKLGALGKALAAKGVQVPQGSLSFNHDATIGPPTAVMSRNATMPAPSQDDPAFQAWARSRGPADAWRFGGIAP